VTHAYAVGLAAAEGDAFLLCDAADEVGEGWLDALGEALGRHELVAAVLEYDRLNPERARPKEWKQQAEEEGFSTFAGPTHWPYASGCSLGLAARSTNGSATPTSAARPAGTPTTAGARGSRASS
jgi:hypothetical protein